MNTRTDKLKVIAAAAAISLAAILLIYQLFSATPDIGEGAAYMVAIDAKSGAIIERFKPPATGLPWKNPDTGELTLYPAEMCWYQKDGKVKSKATYVLVRKLLGESGETTCPDCGRRVVLRNPAPRYEEIEKARSEGR